MQCVVRSFAVVFDVLPNPANFDTESCTLAAVKPDFAEYWDYAGLEDSMCKANYDDHIGGCVDTWADNAVTTG